MSSLSRTLATALIADRRALGMTQADAAALADGQQSAISRYESDAWPAPAMYVAALAEAGGGRALSALCRMAGGHYVPSQVPVRAGSLGSHYARTFGGLGELMDRYSAALADGVVEPHEHRELADVLERLSRQCQELLAVHRAALEGGRVVSVGDEVGCVGGVR